jgi:hypothetical protein
LLASVKRRDGSRKTARAVEKPFCQQGIFLLLEPSNRNGVGWGITDPHHC